MKQALAFGVGVRDITPPYAAMAYGYGARDRKSHGVAEPISLAVLAITDGERTVLLASLDLIGIPTPVCRRLYERLAEATGVRYPDILISCSHTHFAPGLHATAFSSPTVGMAAPDPRFVSDVETKLVEASREAMRVCTPGALETVRLPVPAVVFNRRTVTAEDRVVTNYLYPDDPSQYRFSPVDPQLTLLRIRDERGVRAAWINFGCHPVTGTDMVEDGHYRFSADYPHYLRQAVAAAWRCPVLFALGAAGDAVPVNRRGDCRKRIGETLANSVILAERMVRTDHSSRLNTWVRHVTADTIVTCDEPQAEQTRFAEARERLLGLQGPDADANQAARQDATEAYSTAAMRAYRAALYPRKSFDIPLQFVALGSTTLVGLPFEVLSEISRRMKQQFPQSVLLSCSGGYQGYLPLEYEYERGGYEATPASTHFVPGTGDRILEAILEELGARESD